MNGALILLPLSISAHSYRYFMVTLSFTEKKWEVETRILVRSHLGIKLGISRTEGRPCALTNCAQFLVCLNKTALIILLVIKPQSEKQLLNADISKTEQNLDLKYPFLFDYQLWGSTRRDRRRKMVFSVRYVSRNRTVFWFYFGWNGFHAD